MLNRSKINDTLKAETNNNTAELNNTYLNDDYKSISNKSPSILYFTNLVSNLSKRL